MSTMQLVESVNENQMKILPCHGEGRGFESLRSRHLKQRQIDGILHEFRFFLTLPSIDLVHPKLP